jgi:GTP1/Obg family GTP-binding protein
VDDRRSPARRQIDAYLDDLQSEIEAGARAIRDIQDEASRVGRVWSPQLRPAEVSGQLMSRVSNLQRSVRVQLDTLKELRMQMRGLRSSERQHNPTS